MNPLPIDNELAGIRDAVRTCGAAVVVAPPGTGKTTRVPPLWVDDGPVILLQPRRVAARSLTHRIAGERGWEVGQEIGWHIRFDRRASAKTRLLVATEGILNAYLQRDPLLGTFKTVVLDEFHERSIHADLALALLREARRAREDLRIVVMSATIDPAPIVEYLGECAVFDIQARIHPLEVNYEPRLSVGQAILHSLQRPRGHLLAFLPGAADIEKTQREIAPRLGGSIDALPLHGSLDLAAQERALAPSERRKVILATNIAETSLTVDGVTDVVDSGLHKVLRRDPALGLDRLEIERISAASAEQRAGRAGRLGPGRALRLWDSRDELKAQRESEIRRVDLASALLAVFAWGSHPEEFGWFEAPDAAAMRESLTLLERLGATRRRAITPLGRALLRFPLHPRLARVLLAAGGSARAAAVCAVLDDGWRPTRVDEATTCDLFPAADRIGQAPRRLREAARQLRRAVERLGAQPHAAQWQLAGEQDELIRRALMLSYPDRIAQRRAAGSPRLKLARGYGAVLARESGVREGEFLLALELRAARRGAGSEARVTAAVRIEQEWIEPTGETVEHVLHEDGVRVHALRRLRHGELVLGEQFVEPDAEKSAALRAHAMQQRGLSAAAETAMHRLRFAGIHVDLAAAMLDACRTHRGRFEFDPTATLEWQQRQELLRLAPPTLEVPSGRQVALEYREDGSVVAAVKLQELFGCADSPRLGPQRMPVIFSLLAPNGRPVQTTQDLRSFWDGAYRDVRKELRGRYPKHPWPEDPWNAEPTARTRRNRRP